MSATRATTMRPSLPLPPDRSGRLLPWLFALMVYIAGLGVIGVIVLADALGAAETSLASRLSVQLPADVSNARLETVLALLRQTPGVNSVHLFDPTETARLLEPWLGQSAPLDQLPVPRLIDVASNRGSTLDVAALRRQLNSVVPTARIEDHRASSAATPGGARRIEVLLGAVIVIALLLLAATAGYPLHHVRQAGRSDIALLHVLGAADNIIARSAALHVLGLGLVGGAIGAIAVALTMLALGGLGTVVQLPVPVVSGLDDWRVWLVLILLVPLAGLITLAGAWITASRRLAGMV